MAMKQYQVVRGNFYITVDGVRRMVSPPELVTFHESFGNRKVKEGKLRLLGDETFNNLSEVRQPAPAPSSENELLGQLLSGSVAEIKAQLPSIDNVAILQGMVSLERNGENRTTLLAAIEQRIAQLQGG